MTGRGGRLAAAAATAGYALLAALTLGWAVAAIRLPWPLEFREAAIPLTTDLLAAHVNPWALAQQPLHINVYGIVYHLVLLPVAWVAGTGLGVHRAASLAFVLLVAAAFYRTLRREGIGRETAAIAALFWFSLLAQGLSISARPDSLGLLLFWLSLTVPLRAKLGWPSLLGGAGLAVLAFFTKPYFILALPLLAGWLCLFVSVRKGLFVAGVGVVAAVTGVWLVNRLLPAYFTDTFFIHRNIKSSSWPHLFTEGRVFAVSHGMLLLAALAAWRGARRAPAEGPAKAPDLAPGGGRAGGLLPWRISFPAFATLAGILVMVLGLGRHLGNRQLYYHHLLTPFVTWWAARLVDRAPTRRIVTSLALLAGMIVLLAQFPPWPTAGRASWQTLFRIVRDAREPLAAPPLAFYAHRAGKQIWDNGQTQYCPWGGDGNPSPIVPEYRARCLDHAAEIRRRLLASRFDVVIAARGPVASPFVDPGALGGYRQADTLPMVMPFGSYLAEVWLPAGGPGPAEQGPGRPSAAP